MSETLTKISELMQRGNAREIKVLTQQAIDEGVNPKQILDEGLLAAMSVVGVKFKNNEVFVPEVLIAARAMKSAVEILNPYLKAAGVESLGKAIICTVKGDLHDIGKNLVRMMVEGAGIDVVDLGVDVGPEQVVQAIRETGSKVVLLSALLTTTMSAQKDTIDAIVAAGIRDQVKIMVGGAPVTEAYAKEIGADAYTPDAASAAEVVKSYFVS
jgi:5-methyltetrahydrofolate--homocysteine methyltransferase